MNENAKKKISELIEKNEVCLFMKGTPEVPQCGFSLAISNVLKHLGVNFKGINVLEDNEIREGIKAYSDWPTIPQLYIKKEFIGGCDIVKEMFEKKELQAKLTQKNISYKIYEKNGSFQIPMLIEDSKDIWAKRVKQLHNINIEDL